MRPVKLIVAGPVGAGKTTFVQSLSEIPVVETEEFASEEIGKETTTVGLDYGLLRVGDFEIHLFGTPGQDRFHFMWDILAEGAIGMVLLVSGEDPKTFVQARRILQYVTSRFPLPFIVGVTRQDLERVWRPDEVAAFFALPEEQVVGLNATAAASARTVVEQMLEFALHGERR